MTIRTVPAGNGLAWLSNGITLMLKNPGPFILMGLIYTIISVVPLLGSLALAIIGPTLYGGIAWAARRQDRGENAEVGDLFRGFQLEGKIGPLLLLCLPGVIAGVVLVILLTVVILVSLAGAGMSAAMESPAALIGAMGVGALVLLPVMLALGLLVFALAFFAIPDTMFVSNDAFAAMKQSVRACLANIGAVLLYLVVFVLALVVVTGILALISSLLAQVLVSLVAVPLAGASMYLAWKDVYADSAAELPPAPPAPETPPTPPQDGGGMVA
ncbi:MAG: BPSS1780 family membrane protein [Lysobacteraceae bacterium]